jgi:hypothetical protein
MGSKGNLGHHHPPTERFRVFAPLERLIQFEESNLISGASTQAQHPFSSEDPAFSEKFRKPLKFSDFEADKGR